MIAWACEIKKALGANDMHKFANDTVLGETLAEMRSVGGSPRFWVGLVGTAIILGLTGPFGTYGALPMPLRVAYWFVVVITTFWLGYLVSIAIATGLENAGMGALMSAGLGSLSAAVPLTAWLAGLHVLFFGATFWDEALRLLPYVAIISGVACLVAETLSGARAIHPGPTAPSTAPAWLDQLPHKLGRDLVLLQAQDHYIRVKTTLGETLIRGRLEDAAQDLGDHGIRVHRSWWAARAAISSYRYKNGAPVVILKNGSMLPVGRTYRRSVREALSVWAGG